MERAVDDLNGKKISVYRMENEDWIHGERGILLKFTFVLHTENPTFSVRFQCVFASVNPNIRSNIR